MTLKKLIVLVKKIICQKMFVLTTLQTIGSLEVGKTEHMQRLCQVQKYSWGTC